MQQEPTLPYLSEFSSSIFFLFGGLPRLLPVFPGTFGVFVCPPHPLKNSNTTMKYPPSKGTEAGRMGRRAGKSEQLLGTQPKEGLNQSSNRTGRGEQGFPLAGSLIWEPPARHGAGQTGRNAVGQAASLPQQALPVPQRLQAACDTMHGAGQLPACLATPLAAPLQPPLPPVQQQSGGLFQTWEGV